MNFNFMSDLVIFMSNLTIENSKRQNFWVGKLIAYESP